MINNLSMRMTSAPALLAARAADRPDGPPPTTNTWQWLSWADWFSFFPWSLMTITIMIILVFITTWQRACTGRVLCGSTTLSSPESSATWKKQVDRCGSLDNLMLHIKDRWLMKPPPQKCHLRPPWSKPLRWPACLVAVGPEGVLEVLTDIGWGLALKKEWQSCKRGWWSISRKTKTDQIFLCTPVQR